MPRHATYIPHGVIPAVLLPFDAELAIDLTTPGYDTAHGKRFHGSIILESKDDLRARGAASPDDGDALAMTFEVSAR